MRNEHEFYNVIGTRLKAKREEKQLSYSELAALTGISKSSLQRYETGNTKKIPMEAVTKIEEAMNLPAGYLMGWTDEVTLIKNMPVGKKDVTLLSSADDNDEFHFAENPTEVFCAGDGEPTCDFYITAPDDSMVKARIKKGDIVFVNQAAQPENGDIAVLFIDGKVFLRYAYYTAGYWTFAAADISEPPLLSQNLKKDKIVFLGKAIAFQSKLLSE